MKIPCKVWVKTLNDGLGYSTNDAKYMTAALNRVVTIVDIYDKEGSSSMFITDFYQKEFKNVCNDYIYHGFLIVSSGNIKIVEED